MKSRRIMMSIVGVVVCGISVGIFKTAALGIDPFQTFMAGVDKVIPIPFGTLYVITNIILLSFSLIVDRHNIGLATFINLFLLGYIVEWSYAFFQGLFPDPTMIGRIALLAVGVVVFMVGLMLPPPSPSPSSGFPSPPLPPVTSTCIQPTPLI